MGNLTRRWKRQQHRSLVRAEEVPALTQLAVVAGRSLELSDHEITQAVATLGNFPEAEPDELGDTVLARLLEMVELVRTRKTGSSDLLEACAAIELPNGRAELERRNGPGFVSRVAAMGRPALVALASVGLALLLTLWPSSAKAASVRLFSSLREAHKIQRRNFAALLRKLRVFRHHFRRAGWIRLKKYYATSRRRSLSCPVFATGCARERVSSRSRVRRSKLSWCGGSDASALGACRVPIPISRLNVQTARSSVRPGASAAKGAANANG